MPPSSFKIQSACQCPKSQLRKISSKRNPKIKKKERTNVIFSWMAGLSLVFAFSYGYYFNRLDFSEIIGHNLETEKVSLLKENEYQVEFSHNGRETGCRLVLNEESGYGGPLIAGPLVNEKGIIEKVLLVDNKETHSFIRKLQAHNFFSQFEEMHIRDRLIIGEDIDAVNGATISCVAIANVVRQSAHHLGKRDFNLSYETIEASWEFSLKDYVLLFLFIIASIAVFAGKKRWRYVSLGISLVFLGFYFNSALNVSHFGRLILGFLPSLKSNVFWFIMVFGSIGFAFFLKKNVYCNAMCPFHAVETIMVKIGGIKIKFTPGIQKVAKHSSKFLLWLALMLILISRNPTIGSFEPFAMVFGLEGEGWHWYLLPLVLIGILLIKDYFCRYFCPVGKGFWYIIKFRKLLDSQLDRLNKSTIKKVS